MGLGSGCWEILEMDYRLLGKELLGSGPNNYSTATIIEHPPCLGPLLDLLLTFKTMLSRGNYHPQFREEETESLRGSEHTRHLTASRRQDQNLNPGLSGPQATPPPFQCSIPQVRALRSGAGKGACSRGPTRPLEGLSVPRRGSTETLTIHLASHPCLLQRPTPPPRSTLSPPLTPPLPRSPAALCGLGKPLLSESHFPPL